jgi:dTMP kinase
MAKTRAPFIVIEGVDGAGKTTQAALLTLWLKEQGHDVEQISFPRYGHPAAYFVQEYLDGKYGSLAEVGPYRAAMFFALDRYDAAFGIREALRMGKIVIADRYVASNMASQGAKIKNLKARHEFFKWIEQLEYNELAVPRPDLNLVLNLSGAQAELNIGARRRDLHERDPEHTRLTARTYDELCKLMPNHFVEVPVMKAGALRDVEAIQAELHARVSALVARPS